MTTTIIDLTHPLVEKGIDTILSTYPRDPYRVAFSSVHLRNQLTLYVLKRVPSYYISFDYQRPRDLHEKVFSLARSQQKSVAALIHEGIHVLLPEEGIDTISM